MAAAACLPGLLPASGRCFRHLDSSGVSTVLLLRRSYEVVKEALCGQSSSLLLSCCINLQRAVGSRVLPNESLGALVRYVCAQGT
jgi:hypothetical protein